MQVLKNLEPEEADSPAGAQHPVRRPATPPAALPPMSLGRLVQPEGQGWRVRIGAAEYVLPVDSSVDPALLEEARASGARVVVECSEGPVIAGLLATRRALQVERDGTVNARVRSLSITAEEKALLRVPGAFLQLSAAELELYADRVLTRAREMAKILATLIKLN